MGFQMRAVNRSTFRVGFAFLSFLVLILAPRVGALSLPTLSTLYSFSATTYQGDNSDGSDPSGVVYGSDGNLYGTAYWGGANGSGTVFKITPSGTQSTLYSFSVLNSSGDNSDGANPGAELVLGKDGNFYGTTAKGGTNGSGTVFKITASGSLTTLYSFSALNGAHDNKDGANPNAALAIGNDGNFYGTAYQGGASASGTVFKITTSGSLTTLHSFSGRLGDGANPNGLVLGSDGNFYGTTTTGSLNGFGHGTVFKITPAGTLTTLHSFSAVDFQGQNADGARPTTALARGSDGNFYGTTSGGGQNGDGAVFKITPSGSLTTLYWFSGGLDGSAPGSLTLGSDGYLYGSTNDGGAGLSGTIFKITTSGNLSTLYSFAYPSDGTGEVALVQAGAGSFYGITSGGGANLYYGAFFKLTMPSSAGSQYALWNKSGQASLWKIPATGLVMSASFGPYTGWTPTALASDSSGNAYVLWTTTSGAASVWKLSSSLALATSQSFGPYSGWTARSLAAGPDGHVHVLWNHTSDNTASIFNIALGSSYTTKAFGPFSGWQATQIALDSGNNTRLLWTDTAANEAGLWNITSSGVQTSQNFGSYTGWQAQYLAVGSDNLARLVWVGTSTKQASVFTIAANGTVTTEPLGPFAGWSPAGLAVNNDGDSNLMWTSTSNQLSIFDIGSTGAFTSSAFGPYSGWKAVGLAPGP